MTKDRPILFSGAMVRAILDGRKTQTRRVAKPVKHPDLGNIYAPGALVLEREPQHVIDRACPYGQPGDRLWVRETWQHSNHPFGPYDDDCALFYRADYLDDPLGPDLELSPDGIRRHWRPSIHMPRSACRLELEITGVRVEQLNDCSEADARAEGLMTAPGGWWSGAEGQAAPTPQAAYALLWNSINGAGTWEANPWVWVVEFQRLTTGGDK